MKILIVEDYEEQRQMYKELFMKKGYHVDVAENGHKAIEIFDNTYQLVIVDWLLDSRQKNALNGDEVSIKLKKKNPLVHIVMLSGNTPGLKIVNKVKNYVDVYLEKADIDLLKKLYKIAEDISKYDIVYEEIDRISQELKSLQIIAESTAMKSVLSKVSRIVNSPLKEQPDVIITGQSGTGKEIIARLIHELSTDNRSEQKLVIQNISALPGTLIESELFGSEGHAYTGDVKRKGLVVEAKGGTLFLDEIGDMPVALQAKLLRVLQEKKVKPLGSNVEIPVDFRVIYATNRNLEQMTEAGLFREDLYYRINTVKIHLPPLSSRKEDIHLFINYYAKSLVKKDQQVNFSPDAISALLEYEYPGNIRELKNIVQESIINAYTNNKINKFSIKYEHLPPKIKGIPDDPLPMYDKKLNELAISLINEALEMSGNIKTKAAKYLEINESRLRRELKRLNINIK